MAEAATDPDALRTLQSELAQVSTELTEVEEAWLERSEELEDATG